MNPELPPDYAHRCFTALGQSAHDPEQVTNWCYDNPPIRPLPKAEGIRDVSTVYLEREIRKCLHAIAGKAQSDGLVNAILRQWIQDTHPELLALFKRQRQELEAKLTELRHNEPTLTTYGTESES